MHPSPYDVVRRTCPNFDRDADACFAGEVHATDEDRAAYAARACARPGGLMDAADAAARDAHKQRTDAFAQALASALAPGDNDTAAPPSAEAPRAAFAPGEPRLAPPLARLQSLRDAAEFAMVAFVEADHAAHAAIVEQRTRRETAHEARLAYEGELRRLLAQSHEGAEALFGALA